MLLKAYWLPYWTDCQKCPESGCRFVALWLAGIMRQKWFRGEADGGSEGNAEEIDLCATKGIWFVFTGYVEYELELFGGETHERLLVVGCDDRSMRQTTSVHECYPLMNILCCNERTICSLKKGWEIEKVSSSGLVLLDCILKVFALQYVVNIGKPYGEDCAYDPPKLWPKVWQEYIPKASQPYQVFFAHGS